MAINVICPKCHSRFRVSDKFAGQKGPCPKCKEVIQVPKKEEEVVIHGPEQFEGIKDAKGRSVLKPIARTDAKFSPAVAAGVVGGALAVVALAWLVGSASSGQPPVVFLGLGALALAPPVVWGGYTFLRDSELQPFLGTELWVRVAICSVLYASLWGLYSLAVMFLLGGEYQPDLWHLVFIIPPFLLLGGTVGFASLDLEFGTGCLHYGMYLLITVLLRVVMGMSPF